MTHTLRVIDIVAGTSVDGPGLRTSIYFAGCQHHCPGCHNPQSWDANAGREMSMDDIIAVVEDNGFNVTFSGGDPLFQLEGITELAKRLRALGYTIWCYTGYTFEQIISRPECQPLLKHLEVIVDGPFIESRRNISLPFRGSDNQRLIAVAPSLASNQPTPWPEN